MKGTACFPGPDTEKAEPLLYLRLQPVLCAELLDEGRRRLVLSKRPGQSTGAKSIARACAREVRAHICAREERVRAWEKGGGELGETTNVA